MSGITTSTATVPALYPYTLTDNLGHQHITVRVEGITFGIPAGHVKDIRELVEHLNGNCREYEFYLKNDKVYYRTRGEPAEVVLRPREDA